MENPVLTEISMESTELSLFGTKVPVARVSAQHCHLLLTRGLNAREIKVKYILNKSRVVPARARLNKNFLK